MQIDLPYFGDMSLEFEGDVLYVHFKIFANLPEDMSCYTVLYGREELQSLLENLKSVVAKIENKVK